jgi:site-specific DNA-methyltransferase (adenine-specific)
MDQLKIDIDPEFAALLPSTDYERQQLEQNLLAEGCRDPLVVWAGKGKDGMDLLVDGHTRLSICKAHNIPFKICRMDFRDRDEAMVWIITNQIGRRNLNLYTRSLVALKLETIIAEQAKHNQRLSPGRGKKGVQNSKHLFHPTKTNKILAKIADVSTDTIQKVKTIEKWADDKLKAKLTTGQLSINSAIHKVDLKRREQRRNEMPFSTPSIKMNDPSNDVINHIICADVLDGFKLIDSNSVSLIITDPPWNAGINYSGHGKEADSLPYQAYLAWLKKVWIECNRVLTDGGRLIVVCDMVRNQNPDDKDKELRCPLFADLIFQMREIGDLKFRDRIVVIKDTFQGNIGGFGTYCSPMNPNLRHNSMDLMIWSKGTWQLQPPFEGARGGLSEKEFQLYSQSTWYFPSVKRNKARHPCPFNPEMVSALIRMFSYEGQVVLDPFCGIGTVPLAAKETNRKFIGIEQSKEWCSYARQKL